MCEWKTAKPGNCFVLTTAGFEVGRIRAKFERGNSELNKYEKSVPIGWIKAGYVIEVKKEN